MKWSFLPADPRAIELLRGELRISPLLARLLLNRGIALRETAREFLNPAISGLHDPLRMAGMREAVERIASALARREKILIYGDYDVDGTTAIVILRKAFEILGGTADYYIPRRLVEGYGLHAEVLERAAAEGVRLVISVDTGIRAADVVAKARALGLDCIITDHHVPEGRLPPAVAVLNPKRSDCPYPDKNLCGVGVAFKLVQALLARAGRHSVLEHFLKVVAIGTIADAVPLLGENRIFAKLGLEGLRRPVNPGLQALLEVASLDGRAISAHDVGFRLAPRINAAGRMGEANDVVELFSSTDSARVQQLAERMNALNADRQQTEDSILREILARFEARPELAEDFLLVLDGAGWHRGVIGIVATRIVERFHRPTLVVSREGDVAHGSGRSIRRFNLLAALESAPDLFLRYGGHAHAVGFSLPVGRVPELRERLNSYARQVLAPEDLEPQLELDAEIRLEEISATLVDDLSRLAPYGHGNAAPLFAARQLTLVGEPRLLKERHLAMRLAQGRNWMEAIGWNLAHRASELGRAAPVAAAFEIERHEFLRERPFRLVLRDISAGAF